MNRQIGETDGGRYSTRKKDYAVEMACKSIVVLSIIGLTCGLIIFGCYMSIINLFVTSSDSEDNLTQDVVATQRYGTETYWQDIIQKEIGGIKEYRLDDGTRVDLLFEDKACEIDWANKWAEGIGQSIYYGLKTERPPLVILLAKKDGWEKYRDRVEYCDIECWVYDTRIEGWVDEE
jgi:hypothetical protein